MRTIILLAAAMLASHAGAQGTMYRCQGADGKLSFQQMPCDKADKGQQLEAKHVPTTTMGDNILERAQRNASGKMSEDDMLRELGNPTVTNTDVINGVVSQQHVYRYPDGSARYVYTRNGEVYAAQVRPAVHSPNRQPCHSRQEIDNAYTAASSITLSQAQRDAKLAQAREMSSCRR